MFNNSLQLNEKNENNAGTKVAAHLRAAMVLAAEHGTKLLTFESKHHQGGANSKDGVTEAALTCRQMVLEMKSGLTHAALWKVWFINRLAFLPDFPDQN